MNVNVWVNIVFDIVILLWILFKICMGERITVAGAYKHCALKRERNIIFKLVCKSMNESWMNEWNMCFERVHCLRDNHTRHTQ